MALKKSVINTKLKDLKSLASLFENMIDTSTEYTIGNETKIKEYAFDDIKSL
jgi:hypothetical protein